MTWTIRDTIRQIVDAAHKENGDPVEYVRDYFEEKDSYITRAEAMRLIDLHVGNRKTEEA